MISVKWYEMNLFNLSICACVSESVCIRTLNIILLCMSLHLNYKADNIYGSVTNKDKDACV